MTPPPPANAKGTDAEPGADPDHDGHENLHEFAYNTHPAASTPGSVFPGTLEGDTVVFTITRRRADTHA